jgi:hypothetical protein
MEKLPVEFKEKWVEALRSGKYTQGRNKMLGPNGEMCCLTVACIVAGHTVEEIKENKDYSYPGTEHENHFTVNDSFPPMLLVKGNHNIDSLGFKLAVMNDTGKTFKEIADYIEENL